MILVDDRAGSKELAGMLNAIGEATELTRLDYGDVSFLGEGPDGVPVQLGIEVKTIHDVVKCICDGRFAGHQLPGLVSHYARAWLLVEGLWRANVKTGMLEYRQARGEWREVSAGSRRFMYRDLASWLLTIEVKGGLSIVRASDWNEATQWISKCYQWWKKGWEGHKSHLAFYDGTRHGVPVTKTSLADKALGTRPTLSRVWAAQLPGVGWEKSKSIAERFPTGEDLVMANMGEFMECEGIGPKLAMGIYKAIRSAK